MSTTRWWTILILVVITLGLIGWDIYAFLQPGNGTISEVVLFYAQQHPLIPFVLGVFSGHWFWPQGSTK